MLVYTKEEEYQKVVLPLYLLMQLSCKAYAKYLRNKIYLYALTIRMSNKKIYDFIIEHLSEIPESLQDDVLELLNHYDIWMEQFREFEANQRPSVADLFIFHHIDSQSAFPKLAEQHIFDYYSELKKSIYQYNNYE